MFFSDRTQNDLLVAVTRLLGLNDISHLADILSLHLLLVSACLPQGDVSTVTYHVLIYFLELLHLVKHILICKLSPR